MVDRSESTHLRTCSSLQGINLEKMFKEDAGVFPPIRTGIAVYFRRVSVSLRVVCTFNRFLLPRS